MPQPLAINHLGWLTDKSARLNSPHFQKRPARVRIDTVVLHNISLPPGQFSTGCVSSFFLGELDLSRYPELEDLRGIRVSSHFLIERTGQIIQFVRTFDMAWHAGRSELLGRTRFNDFSIGIEIEGTDSQPFEEVQYRALDALLDALCTRHPITTVVAHSDIAPDRKTDPGPFFHWERIAKRSFCGRRLIFPGVAAASRLSVLNARGGILV